MKKTLVSFFGLAALVLITAISVFGQEKQTTFEREVAVSGFAFQGPGQGEGGNTFNFVNSEFSFDKLVKGAPYSAQAVTEMTQILSDGNRIVNTTSSAVYRDGGPHASGTNIEGNRKLLCPRRAVPDYFHQ